MVEALSPCKRERGNCGLFYNYFDTFPVAVVSEFRLEEPRDVVYLAAVHRRPAALLSETLGNTLKTVPRRKKAFRVEWSRASRRVMDRIYAK